MKKVLFVAMAVVAALSFASCKKKCTCTDLTTHETKKTELDKKTFKNCAEYEEALQATMYAMGYDHEVECK